MLAKLAEFWQPCQENFLTELDGNLNCVVNVRQSRLTPIVGLFSQSRPNPLQLLRSHSFMFDLARESFCSNAKSARSVMAKEILILTAHEADATIAEIAKIVDLDPSTTDRRRDATQLNIGNASKL